MTFKLVDRARETTTSPGTGTATLLGASTGYQSFSAGVGANNTTYYVIADQSGPNWEVGYGTVGAGGTTLARTTVLSSSNAGLLVNFASGTQDVWVDYPATKAVWLDINGDISQAIRNISGITGAITAPESITFDTAPAIIPTATGSIFWDAGNKTPSVILDADVALQLGQENVALVYNGTGATITNGSVVAVNGAQGQRPSVALADADSEALSAPTLGIATEDIANGAEGFVTTFGFVRGINTAAFTAGLPIYLSQTAGQFTQTRPAAPAHTVALGWVIKVNASSGEVFVNINNGWEIGELHDVLISSPTGGQLLAYDQTNSYWKNISLGAGTGFAATAGTGGTLSIGASVAAIGTWMGTPSSANLLAAMTDETGTGSLVFATSPTLVTPLLGTPTSGNLSNCTNIPAGQLTGTIPSAVLGNSTLYVGTTAIALNRASANLALTGLLSGTFQGSTSGSVQLIPAAVAGTGTILTMPATTGTIITSGDTGTVTNTMLAGSIANAKLLNSSVTFNGVAVALGASGTITAANPNALTIGTGLSGTSYNGSAAVTIANTGVLSFSGGTTGLTPSTATTGAVTLAGTLAIANGGTGATTAAAARTNLGATTVGGNFFTLANPTAITFPRINADNTVSALDAATFRTAIGAGTSSTTGTVTSVSGTGTVSGLTLTGTVTTSGSLTLGGTLAVTASNFSSQTANTFLAAPNGAAGVPTFRSIVAADVPTLNQNTTGTAANVTGVVAAANGGTGQSSYAVGDLLYASTTTALSKLADVATGNALISGGVGVAPSWGKIGLTTHISGTLAIGNGGTGLTSFTAGQIHYGSFSTSANLFWDATNNRLGIGTATPTKKLEVAGSIMVTQDLAATTGAVVLRQNSGNTIPAYLQWVNNANSAQTGFITVSTSNVMQFGNSGGTVTMSLDSTGRRTNPNQISFRATYSGADWSSVGTPIIFNSAVPNVGSGYNGTTGVFTVPVSGTYIFYCLALSTLSTVLEMGFWANGGFVISGRNVGSAYASSAYCTFTIPLIAGDTVWCGIQAGTVYGGGFNEFGGYLLG